MHELPMLMSKHDGAVRQGAGSLVQTLASPVGTKRNARTRAVQLELGLLHRTEGQTGRDFGGCQQAVLGEQNHIYVAQCRPSTLLFHPMQRAVSTATGVSLGRCQM